MRSWADWFYCMVERRKRELETLDQFEKRRMNAKYADCSSMAQCRLDIGRNLK
jgi:hypothetical protein